MLNTLTSLRFFFAFFVFLSHLAFITSDNVIYTWLQRNIFSEGYIGVSFFFILSGFVLSYSNQKKFIAKDFNRKNFYLARVFRIYPLHLLTFLAALLFSLYAGLDLGINKVLANLFLVQSFIPDMAFLNILNGPSWSISNEMFFYACFPFLFLAILKNKKAFLIAFIIISLLFVVSVPYVDQNVSKLVYYFNPFTRILDFTLGIILFYIYNNLKTKTISPKTGTVLEFVSLLIFVLFFVSHNLINKTYRYSLYYWIPMASIILIFALQKGYLSKILKNKYLVYLGEISFAFYMIHLLLIQLYQYCNLPVHYIFTPSILLIVTTTLSALIFEYFEKPVNRYLKHKFIK
ncbi:acyltransferase [Soonwooa sp.]|uniref:acyltransferase family protein n=1 Tax=Soonwooa sp. TaxID=1938592 RepID=UPI002633E53F|nr:acyltransferase [Soonwooa sp.]